MAVYLLCCSRPVALHGARHYLGYAKGGLEGVQRRLRKHLRRKGGRLPAVAVARGIPIRLARVWLDGDRSLEARLRKRGAYARICPYCDGSA